MKRLIFCFDGTWNKLEPELATNVVLTAASIERIDPKGVPQIIHYDEGVGTGRLDELRGGMFGTGLLENVREAYRFLVFNYDPGDELYIFGFSRGAFSARTFVGFLRHVGPLRRLHVGRIDEALDLYERRESDDDGSSEALRRFRATYSDAVCIGSDDAWRCDNIKGYASGSVPEMKVAYLGVWDTVGALGVPAIVPFSGRLNREHQFHDPRLTDFVRSARHAVAIDERRRLFPPVLFEGVDELNNAAGFESSDPNAPYQERWFPGVHGSVGGGGDIQGLSDGALAWVLKGARQAGLRLDTNQGTRIHGINPSWAAPLVNEKKPKWSATQLLKGSRLGPSATWQLSPSALRRWRTPSANGSAPYRPPALKRIEGKLMALGPLTLPPPSDALAIEIVQPGDRLSDYALKHYGDANLWQQIAAANPDIDDPHDIFAGWSIRIPFLSQLGPQVPSDRSS